MAKAVHMMIRVLEEARSVAFYQNAFRLEISDRYDFETFTLVYLKNTENDFELELTINKDQSDAYDLGNGYGHLAFVVDDLDGEHGRLKAAGYEPRDIVQFDREGQKFARFFFLADPDGYKIEVLERHGRFQ